MHTPADTKTVSAFASSDALARSRSRSGSGSHSRRLHPAVFFAAALLLSLAGMPRAHAQQVHAVPATASVVSTPAAPATKGDVVAELRQSRVVTDAAGKETLQDASKVKPGDVVE